MMMENEINIELIVNEVCMTDLLDEYKSGLREVLSIIDSRMIRDHERHLYKRYNCKRCYF